MKLVMAIVTNQAADNITDALLAAGFRATRLASTGGFRREGNTTLLMGVDDEDVEPVLAIVRSGATTTPQRKSSVPQPPPVEGQGSGRGALFILPLQGYFQL
jgi:uncharacterized protein YaaQ